MRPDVPAAAEHVEKVYGDKLRACEALVEFVLEVGEPWRGRALGDEENEKILSVDKIVAALFVRASNTHWAALELCRLGFGEKALMLQRSLFEDLVDIYWASESHTVDVVDLFTAHEEHEDMLLTEAMSKHPEIFDVSKLPTFSEARREQLDKMFGDYGDKPWSRLNIHKRVQSIERHWPEGEDRDWLNFFRRVIHRLNNSALHVTSYALSAIRRNEDDETIAFSIGPTGQAVDGALWNSSWMYTQIVRLALRHFDFPQEDRDQLEQLHTQGWALFKTLTAEDLRGVGRNDPCPCGSGKKFKRCHGR